MRCQPFFIFLLFFLLSVTGIIFLILEPSNFLNISSKIRDTEYRSNQNRYCYKRSNSTVIFLHLTNVSDEWHPLEMCAFKTAAIFNPKAGVCILTKSPMKIHPQLSRLSNLEIAPMNITLLVERTPLMVWYNSYKNESKQKQVSKFPLHDLSDALRLAYLYKYGGRYMDTDVLTLKNFDGLQNVAEIQDDLIYAGILFFEYGNPFISAAVENFTTYFVPRKWGSLGQYLFTNLDKSGLVKNNTYNLVPAHIFSPLHWGKEEKQYLLPFQVDKKEIVKSMVNRSYALHLYRHVNRKNFKANFTPLNGSFIYEFLHKYCL